MKFVFVMTMALVLGTFAGSPSYYPTSEIPSSSSSSGVICDIVREIIRKLTDAALEALKDYIRRRISGRSTEENPNILIEAFEYLKSNPNVTNDDRDIFEALLNLHTVEGKTEWGFDIDAAWECLKEIFSDLWNESESSESSKYSSSTDS
ncbi:unnamed protein product [Chironomus riparius]|uniref:Uncharacterized protein n=1 Tax=Chironomus riparius TaxID=315576 RepID=A0A9N9X1F4_9DIPT|nr:unnamed protein product [Chironomus riparius]